MSVLPVNFALFQFIGLWRPVGWSSGWKCLCYNLYSLIVLFIIFTNVFTEMVQLIESYTNLKTFLSSVSIFISMVANLAKAADIFDKRDNILRMVRILVSYPCSPRNSEEELIQSRYDRIIRLRSLANILLVVTAVGFTIVESLFCKIPLQILTYHAWYPMNLSIYTNYLLAWIHQNIAHLYGALITADYDTFVSGFMLQSCAKFDILSYRLSNVCYKIQHNSNKSECHDEKECIDEVIDCIKYHLTIIEFSNYTNDTFSSIMLFQFSVSAGVICVTVYSLAQIPVSHPYFPVLTIYLACMLVQLFLYCYAGSEVTLKSANVAEAIYCNVDWWTTSISVQKKLFFMMLGSTKLVTYTCGKIFDLSIESYKNVVKLSYSTYNVLQQT